ncbi:5-formyltetrahydrofolate cyclo-ligase [Beijerinckia indica subsp. indica ATCC 9039]|uniref:5-formyltetrahydrofolate cyclo-ligase n=2 Tax=Beijerinckia TaxID=532 RepID=B2IFC8_BEII9|nr:5-formyltetrahydrofolate cyclo-ligase [Beijerinckia indica subsp. indica ATCC 9039]
MALARRAIVPAETARAFAAVLAETGPQLAKDHRAEIIGAYAAIGDEVATSPLLQMLAQAGFATALPVTGKRGTPLTFRLWRPGDPVAKGKMGITEPPATAPEVFPDLLFVPLAAADRAGNRIGYGAGFYDLTLAALRSQRPICAIGIAFSCQIFEAVPAEAHDQKLDYLLTEQGLIACLSSRPFTD